jgi:2-aminoethylphosphonate-pyruvate transaminase
MSPLLLTPGPLTTTERTRAAMNVDYGSRDPAFVSLIAEVNQGLADLVGPGFTTVPMQGSGTFAVEAMIGTFVPPSGGLLVCVNGAYGARIEALARRIGRKVVVVRGPEEQPIDVARVAATLRADRGLTHVAAVFCETTTGLLNPLDLLAEVVAEEGRSLLVDAMSAFGAIELPDTPFDAVAASGNKCLEGVPGLAFVIARDEALGKTAGNAHSISLDLHAQAEALARNGQFRFTPPTHVLAALREALKQHQEEGGVKGRGRRYRANHKTLVGGMRARGFDTLLPDALQAPIIVTFHMPEDENFDFKRFYDGLVDRGYAIYPGKLTTAPTFRVGCIGALTPETYTAFLSAVDEVLAELGVTHTGAAQ